MKTIKSVMAGLLACCVTGGAFATEWPKERAINLVVPFTAGGGGDTLARLISARIGRELDQTIIVENKPGAGGNIGTASAARAAPDGYTFAYATNGTVASNHWLYKTTGYSRTDLVPVTRLTSIAAAVVVNPNDPYQTLGDLIAAAKKQPGVLTCGSAGNGTTSHLACEQLKQMAGLNIVHVPYRGGAAAVTDLIGGRISFLIDVMPNLEPQITAGRLRALAVTTADRVPRHPAIPTVAQAGVPDYEFAAWDAIYAPKGTPTAIVEKLNKAIASALAKPEFVEQLKQRGAEPAPTSPAEMQSYAQQEYERLGKVIQLAGAVVD